MPDSKRPTDIYGAPTSMGGSVEWTERAHPESPFQGDVAALERDLKARVRGEVRFTGADKALYATDSSNYRQVPVGVVIPRDIEDVVAAVAVCRDHKAPITHRGAGTSLAGQTANTCVIIDTSKYCDRIVEIDTEAQRARVEPGVRRDQLVQITEEKYHLTFAPDTSTHEYATFGGMIGNNSCGMHSQMARRTQDNVHEMEILLYDGTRMHVGPTPEDELERIIQEGGRKGEIYARLRDLRDQYADLIRERYPDIPRRVSGYNLDELLPENGFNVARALVGSEGTCVTVLEATLKLVESPPERVLLVLGFDDVFVAGDHVAEVGELGPVALEGMDRKLLEYMREKNLHVDYLSLLPEGDGFLIAEFGGATREEARANAEEALEAIDEKDWDGLRDSVIIEEVKLQSKIWGIRESGLGATAHLPETGETWPGWEDSAIPPESVGDYLRDLTGLYDKYGFDASIYGHFGQGCIHTRIPFRLRTADGLVQYRSFIDEASDLCMKYGGSFSAEHGDGQARAELLPKMFGEELIEAFRTFKGIWDPDWKMNPGKVVDPYRIDENLRLGVDYRPQPVETHFAFPEDDGDFAHAAMRCVGVAKCRRVGLEQGEVMCPSFIATREEKHTTRGRARLLFEMLNGDETPDAWDNDDVHDALDLCLACKGCKKNCPVHVDMATYKAEFLSHYYESNRRPRYAFAFGLIHWWARIASRVPGLANFFTQTPGLKQVARAVGGITQEREVPPFAPQTFRDWFFSRGVEHEGRPRVLLFPDTFNNFFKVDTAKAAVEVLEAAGYEVVVPEKPYCCGRPLYDYGWLDLAKKLWRTMLDGLQDEIRAGTPVVALEPSCVAAFRDELPNLMPTDWDAKRLHDQVHTLGEFLNQHADHWDPPKLDRKALVHGHCHHLSIMGIEDEMEMLEKMGVDATLLNSGCCGVAGSFGFEEGHYDVSMECGEYALLPSVREADADTLIISDGFSCREQIHHATDRHGVHLAEVLHMALHAEEADRTYPERPYVRNWRFSKNGHGAYESASADEASPARPLLWVALGAAAVGAATYLWTRD